jgi:hypothetical protein
VISYRYFYAFLDIRPIFPFYGITIKKWLLGDNYKHFDKLTKFRGIFEANTPHKVDDSIADKCQTIQEAHKVTPAINCLIFHIHKPFNNMMT